MERLVRFAIASFRFGSRKWIVLVLIHADSSLLSPKKPFQCDTTMLLCMVLQLHTQWLLMLP
jgi:hypothetical protein